MTGNSNYRKGRRKEYKIIERMKKEDWDILQRSSGSHSPIDVIAINKKDKKILLIQSKPNDFSEFQEKKLMEINKGLTGNFEVNFVVM